MRIPLRPLRTLTLGLVLAATLGLATPARADTVLFHEDWSCDVPYSGESECAGPLLVPPGGFLWIGIGDGGPTVFRTYTGAGADRHEVNWGEMLHGEGRFYENRTDEPVLVDVTMHEDAPTNRCGTEHEQGFIEVRR